MKTQISLEEVEAINKRRAEINAIPFADIEWTRDGQPKVISPEVADEWRFIGLSNTSFVEFCPMEVAQ